MSIFQTYLAGLAVVHLAWLYFFTTGLLVRRSGSSRPHVFSIGDLVITSAAGMGLSGFSLLALGFAHLLNAFAILIVFLVEGVLFWRLKGDNWLSWTFWRQTLYVFISAWRLPALVIYLVFLVLAVPAALPPTFADSVTYHLPYAVDWANAGGIYVDQFLRFPYYANNFLILYSGLFVLKLGDYCQFLTWLCGLLTCLGVLAFFASEDFEGRPARFLTVAPLTATILVPLGVAFSPVFLRYLNVGMPDVPIGLFILVPVLCAYRTLSGQALQGQLAVTAAFCVGMKLTLIGHLPFFLVSLLFVSVRRLPRRQTVVLCLVLVVLSLPWYVRNFIDCRDPIPPVFNFYFNHADPIFTRADSWIYTPGTIETQPRDLLLLPFRFFAHPESPHFAEIGANAMILFLYGPILFLLRLPYLQKRWPSSEGISYVSASVVYLVFPWLFSSLGRHSLHWYPVLAAWVGIVVSRLYAWALAAWHSPWQMGITRLATTIFCCSLLFPTPSEGCTRFYKGYFGTIVWVFQRRDSWQAYLREHLSCYSASQTVAASLLSNQKSNTKVLLFPGVIGPTFYLRNAKIISVGDYFGPARYVDLARDILNGNCFPYLTRFDISAIILQPSRWSSFCDQIRVQFKWNGFWKYRHPEDNVAIFLRSDISSSSFYDKFRAQLKGNGFREYRHPEDHAAIFLRSDINPSSQLIPVTQ